MKFRPTGNVVKLLGNNWDVYTPSRQVRTPDEYFGLDTLPISATIGPNPVEAGGGIRSGGAYLDIFDRSSLGGNWTTPIGGDPGSLSISNNMVIGDVAGNASGGYNVAQFDSNMRASMDVPILPSAGDFFQIWVRLSSLTSSANSQSAYFLRVTPSTGVWDIRIKNFAPSASLGTGSQAFSALDSARLTAEGSTISAWYRPFGGSWTLVLQLTDTTLPVGGYGAISINDTVGRLDNVVIESIDPVAVDAKQGLAITGADPLESLQPVAAVGFHEGTPFAITLSSSGNNSWDQIATVSPSTQYTFSFYAKRGTATDATYSVYDWTHSADIVATTSYYSLINSSGWTRVTVTFTTPAGCISAGVYLARDAASTGTILVAAAQLELGSTATTFEVTAGSAGSKNLLLRSVDLSASPWSSFFGATIAQISGPGPLLTGGLDVIEANKSLAAVGSSDPYEAKQGVAATAIDQLDTKQGLAITGVETVESTKPLAITGVEAVDALKAITAAGSADSYEANKTLAVTALDPLDAKQSLAVTALDPVDAKQKLAVAGASNPLEELQGVHAGDTSLLDKIDGSTSSGLSWGTSQNVAQSFTLTTNGLIDYVDAMIYRRATVTDNVVVTVFSDNGSGLPLAAISPTSQPVAGSGFGLNLASATVQRFTFNDPVRIDAGTRYHIVFSRDGGSGGGFDYGSVKTNVDYVGESGSAGGFSAWGTVSPADFQIRVHEVGWRSSYEAKQGLAIVGTADPYEAPQKLAITTSEALEALKALAVTNVEPYEAEQGLAKTASIPFSAFRAVTATALAAFSALKALAIPGSTDPTEATKALVIPGSTDPAEATKIVLTTGTADSFEAKKALSSAASDVLESNKGLALVGNAYPLEAKQGLARTLALSYEATQKLALTGTTSAENTQPIQKVGSSDWLESLVAVQKVGSSDPAELLKALVVVGPADPFEALKKLAVTAAMNEESTQPVQKIGSSDSLESLLPVQKIGSSDPGELLKAIATVATADPFETSKLIAATVAVWFEALQVLARTAGLPFELVVKLAILAISTAEAQQPLVRTVIEIAESLTGVTRTVILPFSAKQGIRATLGEPVDTRAQGGVSNVADFPLEVISTLAITRQTTAESLQGLRATTLAPFELLKALTAAGVVPAESLKPLAITALLPAEAKQGISTTDVASFEALCKLAVAASLPYESTAITFTTVGQTTLLPFDVTALKKITRTTGAESLTKVTKSADLIAEAVMAIKTASGATPVETTQSLRRTLSSPVEALVLIQRLMTGNLETLGISTAVSATALLSIDSLQRLSQQSTVPWEFYILDVPGFVVLVDSAVAQAVIEDTAIATVLIDSEQFAQLALTDEAVAWLGLTDQAVGGAVLSDEED